jgi:hypothetical protein
MERNDLDEMMAMAELEERDFTAERRAVVVSMGDGTEARPRPHRLLFRHLSTYGFVSSSTCV